MSRSARIRAPLFIFVISLFAMSLIATATGQQSASASSNIDLDTLLKRMKANIHTNNQVATRYTFDGTSNCKIYNTKSKLLSDSTDKWVTVTIDGVQYDRMIEENGKPLSLKRQIAEQRRSDAVGKLGKGYDFVFNDVPYPDYNVYSDLPISYLDTLFDNRVLGHQAIDGRDTLIVESTPRADAKPQSDREKTALDWRETTWIDVKDAIPSRYDVELINRKGDTLLPRTTSSTEFARLPVTQAGTSQLPAYVWLQHAGTGHFIFAGSKNSEVYKEEFYNYRRFQADAHVREDSVEEVPAPDTDKHP
jgi:hypothetical protein